MAVCSAPKRPGGGFPGEVPAEPLRAAVEAYVASGRGTWSEVARAAGYAYARAGRGTVADTSSLKRRLGLTPTTWVKAKHRPGGPCLSKVSSAMRYETAIRICRAIEVDPVDLGL